jgi:hypothetical protein
VEGAVLFRELSQRPWLGRFNEDEYEIYMRWRAALENLLGKFYGVLEVMKRRRRRIEKHSV